MFKCNVCGSTEYKDELVNKVFNIDGDIVLVESIPAEVCKRCGEENFTSQTLAHIQNIVYNKTPEYIKAKKFEYA